MKKTIFAVAISVSAVTACLSPVAISANSEIGSAALRATIEAASKIRPEVTYLSQRDAAWAGKNVSGYSNIASSGCFPTVVAMSLNALVGTEFTPVDTAKILHDNGYYGVIRGNLLSEGTFSDAWGFIGKNFDVKTSGLATAEEVKYWLKDNGLVAASVQTVFVSGGAAHEILLTDVNGSQVYVMDPLNEGRNGWYELDTLMDGASTEWWNTFEGSAFVGIK